MNRLCDNDTLLGRIIDWNRVRNGLEFTADLEAAMLSEEANEFFHASYLVDLFDAYCDFTFVAVGTFAKFANCKYETMQGLRNRAYEMKSLEEYIFRTLTQMEIVLRGELTNPYHLKSIRNACLRYVIQANEKKGIEKVNGKIQKGPNWTPPEDNIRMHLEEIGEI